MQLLVVQRFFVFAAVLVLLLVLLVLLPVVAVRVLRVHCFLLLLALVLGGPAFSEMLDCG
jgi:hypothetical protein